MESFTEVLKLKPHELQLGFLKFLPGAPIRDKIESNEYHYLSFPPYEFLSHKDLSAEEVRFLKQFNETFDLFYNSKRFQFSLDHLFQTQSPVEVFKQLMAALEKENRVLNALSLDHQYRIFAETFCLESDPLGWDLLQLDFLYHQRSFRLPGFMTARLASNGSKPPENLGRRPQNDGRAVPPYAGMAGPCAETHSCTLPCLLRRGPR